MLRDGHLAPGVNPFVDAAATADGTDIDGDAWGVVGGAGPDLGPDLGCDERVDP